MTSRTLMLALLGTVIATATAEARATPVVALDYWWLRDYAKLGCETPAFATPACFDLESSLGNFIATLETHIAVEPLCHGITFAGFYGPNDPSPRMPRSWDYQLMIDYWPGHVSQSWSITRTHPLGDAFEGKGTPKEIAHDVCAGISGIGGSIVH